MHNLQEGVRSLRNFLRKEARCRYVTPVGVSFTLPVQDLSVIVRVPDDETGVNAHFIVTGDWDALRDFVAARGYSLALEWDGRPVVTRVKEVKAS